MPARSAIKTDHERLAEEFRQAYEAVNKKPAPTVKPIDDEVLILSNMGTMITWEDFAMFTAHLQKGVSKNTG